MKSVRTRLFLFCLGLLLCLGQILGCAMTEQKIKRDAIKRVHEEGGKDISLQSLFMKPYPYVTGISRRGKQYFVDVTLAGNEFFPRRYQLLYDIRGKFVLMKREASHFERSDNEMEEILKKAWSTE